MLKKKIVFVRASKFVPVCQENVPIRGRLGCRTSDIRTASLVNILPKGIQPRELVRSLLTDGELGVGKGASALTDLVWIKFIPWIVEKVLLCD